MAGLVSDPRCNQLHDTPGTLLVLLRAHTGLAGWQDRIILRVLFVYPSPKRALYTLLLLLLPFVRVPPHLPQDDMCAFFFLCPRRHPAQPVSVRIVHPINIEIKALLIVYGHNYETQILTSHSKRTDCYCLFPALRRVSRVNANPDLLRGTWHG